MASSSIFQSGNTAVITGGASGIGLALAKRCQSAGMKVLVIDNNAESLQKASESGLSTHSMDVGNIDEWTKLKSKVESEFGHISLLALNAGIGAKSDWTDTAYFHKIMSVNLFGVIHGISTLLPLMASQGPSHAGKIIITGSKQGITNPPGNPAYNASKAAIKTLAEHLSYDLRETKHLDVHLLVPGWTFTGLTGGGGVKEKPEGAWWPEQVVEFLEKKMDEGKFYVVCPDNDVTEEKDKKRMLYAAGDAVYERQPLSRWREESKESAEEWMGKCEL